MAASFTLRTGSVFPDGTSVAVYAATDWGPQQLPPVGAPPGSQVTSGSVAVVAGPAPYSAVTFSGLTDGVQYYAAANVGGWRYVGFTPTPVVLPASGVAKNAGAAVSVLTSSTALVAANPNRREVTVCNDHATQVVYLSLGGTAVANQGIRLNAAGGSYTTNAYTGAIAAISVGGTSPVTVTEV